MERTHETHCKTTNQVNTVYEESTIGKGKADDPRPTIEEAPVVFPPAQRVYGRDGWAVFLAVISSYTYETAKRLWRGHFHHDHLDAVLHAQTKTLGLFGVIQSLLRAADCTLDLGSSVQH